MSEFILKDRIIVTFKILAAILVVKSTLINCKRLNDNTNRNIPFKIEIENCETSIDLKLSDLIDSCWLVSLETTKESLLGDFYRYSYITDDNIVVADMNGIYLFTNDGKFIKKIINVGRGPQEISTVCLFYYYDKKDLLLINDLYSNESIITCFDVKAQSFLSPIKKCFQNRWGAFAVYNDSMIMGSILGSLEDDSNPYAIFFQDFNGNFISGIESRRKCIDFQPQRELLQRMSFYISDNQVHVKYIADDTLFILRGSQLSPYLIIQYNSRRIDPPSLSQLVGEKRSRFERYENQSFMIFSNQIYKGLFPFKSETGSSGGVSKAVYERAYFLLNKSNGNYGIINSYTDDFIGKIQACEGEEITFPSSLPNNKLYVLYQPHELLQDISTYHLSKEYPKSLYSQLEKIRGNLKETDNPILLIGVPKKKLAIP